MKKFVLDCSVTIAWCLEDERSPYTEAILDSMEQSIAIVPALWHIEVSNILRVSYKRNRVPKSGVEAFLYELDIMNIKTWQTDLKKKYLFELSLEHNLSAYDACYLDLCISHNLPLATLDKKLVQALLDAGGRIYEP